MVINPSKAKTGGPLQQHNLFNLEDPLLKDAARIVDKLSERGITVFHNPRYGIMLMGARHDSPMPGKTDMNEAYALHNEIAMLFAVQSVAKVAQSMSACKSILADCGARPAAQLDSLTIERKL